MLNLNVKQRRTLLTAIQLLILVGISVAGGKFFGSRLFAKAKYVRTGAPIPYTVTLRQSVHHSDGTITLIRDITEAIRSDGSRVIQLTPITNPGIGVVRNLILSQGRQVTIDEATNLKSSEVIDLNYAMLQRDPSSKCVNSFAGKPFLQKTQKEIIEGEEIVSGYRAVRISNGAGITDWLALDAGCASVKRRWDFGKGGVNEYELLGLSLGDPDPSLFDTAEKAKEVAPSERLDAILELTGKSCDQCSRNLRKSFRKRDEAYYMRQAIR